MRPGLPGKRGYPKLEDDDRQHPIPVPPADGPAASRLYAAGDRHNASDPNFLKARHAGSKVWLDLRGAIRAIRRSSRNSESVLALRWLCGADGPRRFSRVDDR